MPILQDRQWKAAKISVLQSGWPTSVRPPDVDLRTGLGALRARSRSAAQNDDHARAFLREIKANLVGPDGAILQSRAVLRNGNPDRRARETIEREWKRWGEQGSCDVTGRESWVDVQAQCAATIARDGEALYRLVPGWSNRHAFAIQAIDPEVLDVDYNKRLSNGNVVVMGVELDEWRRAVRYHLIEDDPGGFSYTATRRRIAVPAEEIVHCYAPEWVWQTRGVPWMSTALRRMNDLEGYEESAVVAARAGAGKMGWLQAGENAMPIMRADGETESGLLGDGETTSGQITQSFDPGTIGVLPPGWQFAGWDPRYPHSDHGSFVKSILRGVASGLGVSYNVLANDLEGVNYSSLRQGALTERDHWKVLQNWLIACFHQKIFRAWLRTSLLVGALVGNGRPLLPERIDEFEPVRWQPKRWSWVDPEKELKGAQLELELRVRSVSDVIRERGRDPDDVWQEIAEDSRRMEELGISPIFQSPVAATDEPE